MAYECKEYIRDFLNQFQDINFEKEVAFIFPETIKREFFIAKLFFDKADRICVLKNLLENDETINWMVVFDKSKIEDISFLNRLFFWQTNKNSYGGYKLYGYDLAIYAKMLEYDGETLIYKETDKMRNAIGLSEEISLHRIQGNGLRMDTNPYEILAVRRNIKMMIEQGYFIDELDIYYNLFKYIVPVFQKIYLETEKVSDSNKYDYYYFKNKRNDLVSKLLADGVINTKWKSEKSLFDIVKKIYDDAIFQYRVDWLKKQSIDIFIPSLYIAIEYQGVQHYESINYFGGEESFKRRQALDQEKKKKCKENYVKLIEWSYNDPLDIKYVKQRIKKCIEEELI